MCFDEKAGKNFLAKDEEIPQIIGFTLQKAQNSNLPEKRLAHLELALEEILVNIVKYAYENPPGEIFIETQTTNKHFLVNIIDNGIYFDTMSVNMPDINATVEERPIGGLGIMLARNIMDEVHYLRLNNQNKTTFVIYKNQSDKFPC